MVRSASARVSNHEATPIFPDPSRRGQEAAPQDEESLSLQGTMMAIADKLVLQRQHHLKWRALDRLELILMMLCGVLCFGFSLSVTSDIVTRTIGHPWLWLQEVTSTLFIYAIFVGAAVATRRNDHLYLTAISDALHGMPRLIVEIIIPHRGARRRVLPDLVRLYQLSPGFRQLPPAVGHADRLALCGDSLRPAC